MLRVAGVASLICDDIDLPVEKDNIVTACLLHDMGNIIKSDLEYFPEFCEPEGLEYWLKVKEEFVSKYGNNEDVATDKIIRELGLEKILGIWEAFGFLKVFSNRDNSDFNKKICYYSDLRVSPAGVVSMPERVKEGRIRYTELGLDFMEIDREKKDKALAEIEQQIFSHCKIKPEDINDISVAPIISKLKDFVIK